MRTQTAIGSCVGTEKVVKAVDYFEDRLLHPKRAQRPNAVEILHRLPAREALDDLAQLRVDASQPSPAPLVGPGLKDDVFV